MKKTSRKTINLLEPLGQPSDAWTAIYNWVLKVGRYILVTVEIVVLAVFFARFVLDRRNNDLTEDINDNVSILSDVTLREEEIKYRNLQVLFGDIDKLRGSQKISSSDVATVVSGIPGGIRLNNFTYNNGRVTLTLKTSNFNTVKDYEFSLRQNPRYSNVNFTVSKSGTSGSEVEVAVSFIISELESNG